MNKSIFKHLTLISFIALAVFLISFVYEDKTRIEYLILYEEQPLVFVTTTGECYHSNTCQYVSQSKIEKGLYEARNCGFRCCSVCHGMANSRTMVEIIVPYEVVDYNKAILFSFIKTGFLTPLLCLGKKCGEKFFQKFTENSLTE